MLTDSRGGVQGAQRAELGGIPKTHRLLPELGQKSSWVGLAFRGSASFPEFLPLSSTHVPIHPPTSHETRPDEQTV